MRKLYRLLGILMVASMILSACVAPTAAPTDAPVVEPTQAPVATEVPTAVPVEPTVNPFPEQPFGENLPTAPTIDTPLVVAYETFSQKFSPFFADTGYDIDVAGHDPDRITDHRPRRRHHLQCN